MSESSWPPDAFIFGMTTRTRIAGLVCTFVVLVIVLRPDHLVYLLALGGAVVLGLGTLLAVLCLCCHAWEVRAVRKKSTAELEREVLTYELSYFDFIGHDHPDVTRFRRLVESRELQILRREWGKLSSSFVNLERVAGHRGRPLIMDYYCSYSAALAELLRRSRA